MRLFGKSRKETFNPKLIFDSVVISSILKFADVDTIISLRSVSKKFYKTSELMGIIKKKVVKEIEQIEKHEDIERLFISNICPVSPKSFPSFTNLKYLSVVYGNGDFDISLLPKGLTFFNLDWSGEILNTDKFPLDLITLTLGERNFNSHIDLSNNKKLKTLTLWCKNFSSTITFPNSLDEFSIYTLSSEFKVPELPSNIKKCSFLFTKKDDWNINDYYIENIVHNIDIDLTCYKNLRSFTLKSRYYSGNLILPKSLKNLILYTESENFKIPTLPLGIEKCSFIFTENKTNLFIVDKFTYLKELTLTNGWNLENNTKMISGVYTNTKDNEILYNFN